MIRRRWEHFAHHADMGVRGIGRTLADTFEQAALALTAIVTDASIASEKTVMVTCRAADRELLFVEWLNAVIYQMAVTGMLFAQFSVTIEGEVPSIAVKKKALIRVGSVSALNGIMDRLRVIPVVPADDRQIRSHLLHALEEEPALSGFDLREKSYGAVAVARKVSEGRRGYIEVDVTDGVIRFDGEVPGLDYKRLAGLLAWRTPGARDVVNGIGVEPPEEDGPDMIEDSVLLALRMVPSFDSSHIKVGVRHSVVRLTGSVPTELQRDLAENDAWAIFGVDEVINQIEVQRPHRHP